MNSMRLMKQLRIYLPVILILGVLNKVNAIEYKNSAIGIQTHVPPATLLVVDSQGRESGIDPAVAVDVWGGGKICK